MQQVLRITRENAGWLLAGAAAAALAGTVPDMMREAAGFAIWSLVEMSPIIGLAVLASAMVRASGADGLLAGAFAKRRGSAIILSAALGAVTPICGVGVLPIVASLLGSGVPLAPVIAFWLASPVTDPGMLAITAGTLGVPFAVGKTVIAGVIGVGGGVATAVLTRAGAFQNPLKGQFRTAGDGLERRALKPTFWREPARRALFRADARQAAQIIVKWLTIAFVLEGLLRQVLPAEMVAEVVGHGNAWAIPLAVGLGAPIYLDGYAALPLVRGLMDMGMTPGAAMAFLIAGGITSLYASVAVYALVRPAIFFWYLGLAVFFSLISGYIWQILQPLAFI